jgi:hypothetical protein
MNVTFDCAEPRRLAAFWAAATGYAEVEATDERVRLAAPDHRGPRSLLFNRVPEAKAGKNRVHVDLASRRPGLEVRRLVALGARSHGRHRRHGVAWTVMTDPEGNEFCVG